MLTHDEEPVPWAMLLYELDDAHDHLGSLLKQMAEHGEIDEEDFRVQLGHVFAHLNRAWHGRNDRELSRGSLEQHVERSQFPLDLKPCG